MGWLLLTGIVGVGREMRYKVCDTTSYLVSYPSVHPIDHTAHICFRMDINLLLNPAPQDAGPNCPAATSFCQTGPFPLISPKPAKEGRTGAWSTFQNHTDGFQQKYKDIAELFLGLSYGPCHVHPGTKKYRVPFLPEDDAIIVYFDKMQRPSNRASCLCLSLNRGEGTIDSRRDALYGYRPSVSCSACRSLLHKLQIMMCQ